MDLELISGSLVSPYLPIYFPGTGILNAVAIRCRDSGMVQGLPQRLSQRTLICGGVQEDLRQLFPVRRRKQGKWKSDEEATVYVLMYQRTWRSFNISIYLKKIFNGVHKNITYTLHIEWACWESLIRPRVIAHGLC